MLRYICAALPPSSATLLGGIYTQLGSDEPEAGDGVVRNNEILDNEISNTVRGVYLTECADTLVSGELRIRNVCVVGFGEIAMSGTSRRSRLQRDDVFAR